MNHHLNKGIVEYGIFVVLLIIALSIASQIDTITGMATTTTGINTSLTIYDSSDTSSISQGEYLTFYANYTNITGEPIDDATYNGICRITIDTAPAVNMTYNPATTIYAYEQAFPTQGTFNWNVTCSSDSYETLTLQESSTINSTFCGKAIATSINLTSELIMSNGTTTCQNNGLIINASNILIDCKGNTIGGAGTAYGIFSNGFDNLTLTNCTIKGFTQGIRLMSSISNLIYANTFTNNTLHAYTDSDGNHFNTTIATKPRGNDWDNTPDLMIFDSDANNYGDFGQQYPYNKTNGGKVSTLINDWGPAASQTDGDNDGSPDTEDCAPADDTIIAPRNDITITKDTTLCAGTYNINDTVKSGIVRFGADNLTLDCNGAVISGYGSGTGIYTDRQNSTITGCKAGNYYYGIYLDRSNHSKIISSNASGNGYAGITFYNSSFGNITLSTVTDNDNAGIFLTSYSANNTLQDIDAYDNYMGVYLYYSHNNTLTDVDAYDNTWYGLSLDWSGYNTIFNSEYINNDKGIHLSHSHDNNITDVSAHHNNGDGLLLWFSDGTTVFNVSSYNNTGSGIIAWTARHNQIENCTVKYNDEHCIVSYISLDTRLYNNTVLSCGKKGVFIDESNNNTVTGNNITGNAIGLHISGSNYPYIGPNDILDSTETGILIDTSQGIGLINATITGTAGTGINISDDSSIDIFNSTISWNENGIYLSSSANANLTNLTISSNTGFGLFVVNTTLNPSYQEMLASNIFTPSNSQGMLSFNWYLQVQSLNRNASNASLVPIDLTFTDSTAPQQSSTTDVTSITPLIIATEFIINNTGDRINKTYNISGTKGDWYGFNITNITENRIVSESDQIIVTLDSALPPHVNLLSPANGTNTTEHSPAFICNASHEGGLANISIYNNASGNWTLIQTKNITGTKNQTSFTITLSDGILGWNCKARGLFNNSGFALSNFTMRVYTAPIISGGGGGGGGGETPPGDEGPPPSPPPSLPPALPPPAPPPPAPGPSEPVSPAAPAAPAAAESGPTRVNVSVVKPESSVSCNEDVSIVEEELSMEELLTMIEIPEGYRVVAKPFKAQCLGGEKFTMSLMVPDDVEDIQALRCAGEGCLSKQTTYRTRICEGQEQEVIREETFFNISTADVNITEVSTDLAEGNQSLQSGDVNVDFEGDADATLSMVTENQPEPANDNVKIVGTPISLKFKNAESDVVDVTLPYVVGEGEDESSIAIYVKRKNETGGTKWVYLGGKPDTVNKIVKAKINISSFKEEGEMTLAPITIFCAECGEAEFNNMFTPVPDSRQAIILLHGLWGVGGVWEGLVNEFRKTNQPYQLWTFHYFATKPVEDSATDLMNYLEANKYRFDRIYIVGYSLGGLVTQTALRQAYDARLADPTKYEFMDKVSKVLLVAVPNKGSPVANYMDTFLSEYINSGVSSFVPMNDAVKDLLQQGVNIEPVPNITYYSIAGTKPYGFMQSLGLTKLLFGDEPNDGIVGMSSAQSVGTQSLDEDCVNFWSQPVEHTLLIDDRLVQKIMGQVISSDMFKELAEEDFKTNLFGFSNYFDLEIDDCSADDLYVVIGKDKPPETVERVAYCACGNGLCDGIEDGSTCPEDCLVQEKPLVQQIIERSLRILALMIALFMFFGFIFVMYEDIRDKRKARLKKAAEEITVPESVDLTGKHEVVVTEAEYAKARIYNLKRKRKLPDTRTKKQVNKNKKKKAIKTKKK